MGGAGETKVVLWDSGCWKCALIEGYRCYRSCEFGDVSSWTKESTFIAMAGGQRQVMQVQSREDERGSEGLRWQVGSGLGHKGWGR